MIPVLLLLGLVFGRWWRAAPVAAAVAWPAVLVANGVMGMEGGLVGAAGLAVANTLVGVLAHQALLWLVRLVRTPGSMYVDKLG